MAVVRNNKVNQSPLIEDQDQFINPYGKSKTIIQTPGMVNGEQAQVGVAVEREVKQPDPEQEGFKIQPPSEQQKLDKLSAIARRRAEKAEMGQRERSGIDYRNKSIQQGAPLPHVGPVGQQETEVIPMDLGPARGTFDQVQQNQQDRESLVTATESGERVPSWMSSYENLSWDNVTDLRNLKPGKKVYLKEKYKNIPEGNYTITKKRDYNPKSNKDIIKWYAVDENGKEYHYKTEKKQEQGWWDNTLNPFSWFS